MSTERNMKNENFVTFEVAKLLQDKGYREDCHASYRTDETAIRRAKMGPYKRKDSHRCRAQQTRLVLPPVRHGGFVSHIADGRIYRYIRESFE